MTYTFASGPDKVPLRVLITGGAGFLGAALAAALAAQGASVCCLDPADGQRLAGLAVRHVRGSVLDAPLVAQLVQEADLLFHLAAVVGVDSYLSDPAEVLRVNLDGTRNAVQACLASAVPMVLASTSEVYGKNPQVLREDSDGCFGATRVPRWSYALSKAAAEHWCHAKSRDGLRCNIVRYFNVYGPGLDAIGRGRVISKFLGHMRDGEPLVLVDGGNAIRSFCYVDDAVVATIAVGAALLQSPPAAVETYNIGSGEPISIRTLAETLIEVSGHPAGCVNVPGTTVFGPGFEEIPSRRPDFARIESLLPNRQPVSLYEGLRRTLRAAGLPVSEVAPGPDHDPPLPTEPVVPFVRCGQPRARTLGLQLAELLETGAVTNNGQYVRTLEAEAAQWLGVAHVVAVSSGSSALSVAALALGLQGKIALPAFTFQASWAAFAIVGLQPVFCEVDPATWTLDPADLDRRLADTQGVSAVLAVNVFGVAPDLSALAKVCDRHGVVLLYDNCHGLGTEVRGARSHPEPLLTVHSLHATKVIGGVEGGLLLTGQTWLADKCRALRNHGLGATPLDAVAGPNAKLDELRACVAVDGLRHLDARLVLRRRYAARLRQTVALQAGPMPRLQQCPPDVRSNEQNFALDFSAFGQTGLQRAEDHFTQLGIQTRRYFHPALHELSVLGPQPDLPISRALGRSTLCLPLANEMAEHELQQLEHALTTLGEVLS